jgi:hypothetical protein
MSAATRRTSKKSNLYGPLPVVRTLDFEAKGPTSAARFLSPGRWTWKPKPNFWDALPVAKKLNYKHFMDMPPNKLLYANSNNYK